MTEQNEFDLETALALSQDYRGPQKMPEAKKDIQRRHPATLRKRSTTKLPKTYLYPSFCDRKYCPSKKFNLKPGMASFRNNATKLYQRPKQKLPACGSSCRG
jgi:hypothetical protein